MARSADLPNILLNRIMSADNKALEHVLHPSALRIYTVDLLKALVAAADEEYAAVLQAVLDIHPAWRDFKDQSHDLFITDKEKTDVYLIQDSSDKKFAGLLTDGSDMSLFASTGLNNQSTSSASRFSSRSAGARRPSSNTNSTYTQAASGVEPAPVPAPVPRPVSTATPTPAAASSTARQAAGRPASTSMSKPAAGSVAPQTTSGAQILTTTIAKGEHGIGLDLGKSKEGLAQVLKLKDMPAGVQNPAMVCSVPMAAGDIITAVNGNSCASFADTVKLIRSSEGTVTLTFRRGG
jgi:hypothetical protein